MITFCKYENKYYDKVCEFLIELNKDGKHLNWNWARFEWMAEHPLTKKELLGSMGLWIENNKVIGAALIDMFFGEAFIGALKEYFNIYPEILKYAYDNLKDEEGLGIAINDLNTEEIKLAESTGFNKAEEKETLLEIKLDNKFDINLPDGFNIEEYDANKNQEEMSWLMWQGFDHGDNKKEFESDFKPSNPRPHFNPYLCIVVKDDKGNLVASASAWYDKNTDYAYIEPVCVIPNYRKMNLGKSAIYEVLNHARKLGAKKGIVLSDLAFYKHLGFKEKAHFSFYWKK